MIHYLNECPNTLAQILNCLLRSIAISIFFFASGMTPSRKSLYIQFQRLLKQLIVPYVIYIIGGCIFCQFYGQYTITIDRIFYYNGLLCFNEPLWFLIVLFEVRVFEMIVRATKKTIVVETIILVIVAIFGFLSYIYRWDYFKELGHFGLNRAVVRYALYLCGNLSIKMNLSTKTYNKRYIITIITFTALLWITITIYNGNVSMYTFNMGHSYWLFLLSSVFGSSIVLFACSYFDNKNVFIKLSEYGVLMLGSQYFWLIPIREQMTMAELSTFVYILISVVTPILMAYVSIYLYNKISKSSILKVLNGEL